MKVRKYNALAWANSQDITDEEMALWYGEHYDACMFYTVDGFDDAYIFEKSSNEFLVFDDAPRATKFKTLEEAINWVSFNF